MRYLTFDFGEAAEGLTTIEALASTGAAEHAAVMAEVAQVLDWCWKNFPHTHGPTDDGAEWDHDLQVNIEDGQWHAVALTITASTEFLEGFLAEFDHADD